MDGPSGLNQPRRKSRLRSRDGDPLRRVPASPDLESEPPVSGEPIASPVYAPDLDPEASYVNASTGSPENLTAAPEAGEVRPLSSADAAEEGDDDELPEAFRLKKVYSAPAPGRHPLTDWRWLLLLCALLGGGLYAGYQLGQRNAAPQGVSPRARFLQARGAVVGPITREAETEVDDAFAAGKKGNYEDARRRFGILREKHPEWPSMAVEVARTCLYQHDTQEAQNILGVLTANRLTPDAEFITALLHLTNKELDLAETSFGMAVALDPARPDFYFFWGECLRRDGKPQEAIGKFRAALLRNQYENAEGLYQLKLWLSEIQADREESSGGGKEIDAALSQPHPPYEALFAAAGRAIKVRRFADAADFIRQGQAITEPAVFRVILQDPTFLEESTRPQLAGFYQ